MNDDYRAVVRIKCVTVNAIRSYGLRYVWVCGGNKSLIASVIRRYMGGYH